MGKLNFVSRELEITFDGTVYKLRYPLVKDIRKYNKDLEAKDAVEFDVVTEMLFNLGLSKAVIEKMEMPFIEAIIEELVAKKKK